MPLNFPETPALNQYYVFNGIRWRWNGYAWVSAGVCGGSGVFAGISGDYVSGITGGPGITVSGPTGFVEVSIKLDEPNVGSPYIISTHTAPTSLPADSGPARKVAFLQENGSVQFDYIKNYDVFRKSEFEFDILSYSMTPSLSPQLIGQAGIYFSLNPYLATMTYNQTPLSGELRVFNTSSIADQNGFPATITSVDLSTFAFGLSESLRYRTLNYTNVGPNLDYYNIRLGVTGQDADGTIRFKTKDYNVYFYNYVFYGQSQLTEINQTNFSSLTPLLIGSRSTTINITITQDNATPYYLYYAYPARLGIATFKDNSTNIEGGFFQQVGTYNYLNSNGYNEPYVVWRSEQGNLGTVSISVT